MKIYNITITFLSILLITSCTSSKFPNFEENKTLIEGDIIIKQGIYKNKKDDNFPKKIKTDYISLAVKENRNNSGSRIIVIPVMRLHSLNNHPKEPVFLLDGGPGSSNIGENLVNNMLWLLDNHDIIMVGYRGVDGSVQLDSDAFGEALILDSNAFSEEHFKELGKVWKKELVRYKDEGIDINGYNMIEVVDDIELVRNKLGYRKINIFGYSYGTRLAYFSSLRYPESIHRSIIGGVNPPNDFVWNPEVTDSILKEYGELWKKDSMNLVRSPDIIKTIQNVFSTLPATWKKINLDPGKIRVMMFNVLYKTSGAGQVFDAFVAAENGDHSGIALLVMMYDMIPETETIFWGDLFAKSFSADYQPNTNYISAMDSKDNLLGAPLSKLFSIADFSDWKVQKIPQRYRELEISYINTLVIAGNFDIVTPLENAHKILKYLPNGHLTIFTDYGHHNFGSLLTDKRSITMLKKFYLTGAILDKDIKHIPVNLGIPKESPQKMGKMFYRLKRLGLLKTAVKLMQ